MRTLKHWHFNLFDTRTSCVSTLLPATTTENPSLIKDRVKKLHGGVWTWDVQLILACSPFWAHVPLWAAAGQAGMRLADVAAVHQGSNMPSPLAGCSTLRHPNSSSLLPSVPCSLSVPAAALWQWVPAPVPSSVVLCSHWTWHHPMEQKHTKIPDLYTTDHNL